MKSPPISTVVESPVVLNQTSEGPVTLRFPPTEITGRCVVDNRRAFPFVWMMSKSPRMFRKWPFKSTNVDWRGHSYVTLPKFCLQPSL